MIIRGVVRRVVFGGSEPHVEVSYSSQTEDIIIRNSRESIIYDNLLLIDPNKYNLCLTMTHNLSSYVELKPISSEEGLRKILLINN